MIIICTIKIPMAVDTKFRLVSFMDTIKGIDSSENRNSIETNEISADRFRDAVKSKGRICPIKTKLTTLKSVPSTKPLAMGLCPIKTRTTPATTAVTIALDPIFFCMWRMISIYSLGSTTSMI